MVVDDGTGRVQPNMRLKLSAPALKGSVVFVSTHAGRRSLSAIR